MRERFQELSEACCIPTGDVECALETNRFDENDGLPQEESDALRQRVLQEIIQEQAEMTIAALCERMQELITRCRERSSPNQIGTAVAKVKCAIAIAATAALRKYHDILPEGEFDLAALRDLQPSPYGNGTLGETDEGEPITFEDVAADTYYGGDLDALYVARELGIEVCLP